jgi:hypothetical protein
VRLGLVFYECMGVYRWLPEEEKKKEVFDDAKGMGCCV